MTGLAAHASSCLIVKLEDNAEQLPSAYIDKEKLPVKLLEGGGIGGGGVGLELHVTLRAAIPVHLGSFGDWPTQDPDVPFWKEPPRVQVASRKPEL